MKYASVSSPITSRELNQRSGRIMQRSREERVAIPVTYGGQPEPVNYIVPNDPEVIEGLLNTVREQRAQAGKEQTKRERFLNARKSMAGKAAESLESMRNEETF